VKSIFEGVSFRAASKIVIASACGNAQVFYSPPERLAPRCALAGIEIALVGSRGEVIDVKPAGDNERGTGRRDE